MIFINGKETQDIINVLRVMVYSKERRKMVQIWPSEDDQQSCFGNGYWIDEYYWDDNTYWDDD